MDGKHSSLDWDTLKRIAKDAEGCPVISLIWTHHGLLVEVVENMMSVSGLFKNCLKVSAMLKAGTAFVVNGFV
jgi:hypothetical protein